MGCAIRCSGCFVICSKHLKPKNGPLKSDIGTILQECPKLRVVVEKKELTAQRNCTDLQKFVFYLKSYSLEINFVI